jgi:hypothetical protein
MDTEMIQVTVEIRAGALTYRVRVTATSIERALEIAGEGETRPQSTPRLSDRP